MDHVDPPIIIVLGKQAFRGDDSGDIASELLCCYLDEREIDHEVFAELVVYFFEEGYFEGGDVDGVDSRGRVQGLGFVLQGEIVLLFDVPVVCSQELEEDGFVELQFEGELECDDDVGCEVELLDVSEDGEVLFGEIVLVVLDLEPDAVFDHWDFLLLDFVEIVEFSVVASDDHLLVVHGDIPLLRRELPALEEEERVEVSVHRYSLGAHKELLVLLRDISGEYHVAVEEEDIEDGGFLDFEGLEDVLNVVVFFYSEFGGDGTDEFVEGVVEEPVEELLLVVDLVPLDGNFEGGEGGVRG